MTQTIDTHMGQHRVGSGDNKGDAMRPTLVYLCAAVAGGCVPSEESDADDEGGGGGGGGGDAGTDDQPSTSTFFRVVIVSAKIRLTKDTAEAWDWDGNIDDWVWEALVGVANFYNPAIPWSDLVEFADQTAPFLLQGTVPPDPFLAFSLGENAATSLGFSESIDDTYEPLWNVYVDVQLSSTTPLRLDCWDADIVEHDWVSGAILPLDWLQYYAGDGPVTLTDLGALVELVVEVEER